MSRHAASPTSTSGPSQDGFVISYASELRVVRRLTDFVAGRFAIPFGVRPSHRNGRIATVANKAEIALVPSLVLDCSAFAALERGDADAREHLTRALGAGARIVAAANVLTEPRFAALAAAVATIVPIDPPLTRCATGLLARASLTETADALTVATALREWSATILTGNGRTISLLVLAAQHAELNVVSL